MYTVKYRKEGEKWNLPGLSQTNQNEQPEIGLFEISNWLNRVSSEWNFSFQFLVFRMVLFSFEICSCVSSDVLLKFQFSIFSFIFVFCPPIGGYYNDIFNTPPTLSRPIRLLSDYPRQIHSFDWDSMPAQSFLETTRQKQATVMKHLDHLYQLPLQHSM